MKNISTGAGLAIVGFGLALHPVLSHLIAETPAANASTLLVTSASSAQVGPTVVWMGVSQTIDHYTIVYHRLWSDGRLEFRSIGTGFGYSTTGCWEAYVLTCGGNFPWREVPPPTGGNGFACRSDINGDRIVNGADLTIMLNAWGQEGGCEPEATYPCLDLGSLTNAAAMK